VYELLDEVYASERPYVGRSLRLLLNRAGPEPQETFFDFVYEPLFERGRVSGIAVVCFEVTELAKARRPTRRTCPVPPHLPGTRHCGVG
jgi:hypothetical protein